MISVELNTAVKTQLTSLGSPYSDVDIFPLSAYENTDAPFITYFEYPGTQSEEQFFLKISNVIYYIYDTDISRMKDIAWELDKFLNVGDNIELIKSYISMPAGYGSNRYRLTTCRKVSGIMLAPNEREGFAVQSLNFRVVYIDV